MQTGYLDYSHSWADFGCGVTALYDFYFEPGRKQEVGNNIKDVRSGTGYFVAAFIDNHDCKAAYEYFSSKMKIVFQSEVRTNINSYNDFFFCVFDSGVNP